MRRGLLLWSLLAVGCAPPSAEPPADAGAPEVAAPDAGVDDAGPPPGPGCGDGLVQAELGERCDDGVNDGRPGRCDPGCAFVSERVVFAEIQYNPVKRDDFVERHEFIELLNTTPVEVDLSGWRIEGVELVLPLGARVGPGERAVIPKDRSALEAVYGPVPGVVVDGYPGALDNGGESLVLVRDDGSVADRVDYDDELPWPRGADALGADAAWLADVDDLEVHRFRGRSLERVSAEVASARVENWVASPLPAGPTPGAPGLSARPVPLDVLLRAEVVDGVLEVQASDSGPLSALAVELFVDELGVEGEPTTTIPLEPLGQRRYRAPLPPVAERAIVRWRVVGDRGAGLEVIEPRAGDPAAWRAIFGAPDHSARPTRTYELFIAPDDWTALFDNVASGRVDGCAVRPEWQETRPAVFVHEGHVYDVQVRYQGSRYNRTNGARIPGWPAPGPARPNPLRALSWKIEFPAYDRFEGRDAIILNKLQQACSGLYQGVGFALLIDAGVPAPDARYARLFINGAYYNYSLEMDHVSEQVFARFHDEVGHLFKAKGAHLDEGPWGTADGRLFDEFCGYPPAERYAYNYDRKTHGWAGHDELIALIEDLHAARAAGDDALRAYLEARWDVDQVLTLYAIMNWLAPWDDNFHNYYLYQRREDDRWTITAWDLDLMFGDFFGGRADVSLTIGTLDDPESLPSQTSFFKDSFLRAFPDAYAARVLELNETLLAPAALHARIDAWRATADVDDAASAPAGAQCDFDAQAARTREWVQARHDFVAAQLAPGP